MKLITREMKVATALEYYCGGGAGGMWRDIASRLAALGPNPTPDAVDAAVGTPPAWTPWTMSACNGCNSAVDAVVLFDGSEADAIPSLCAPCLLKATLLLDPSPALVLADWLEEQGQGEAADLVRGAWPERVREE